MAPPLETQELGSRAGFTRPRADCLPDLQPFHFPTDSRLTRPPRARRGWSSSGPRFLEKDGLQGGKKVGGPLQLGGTYGTNWGPLRIMAPTCWLDIYFSSGKKRRNGRGCLDKSQAARETNSEGETERPEEANQTTPYRWCRPEGQHRMACTEKLAGSRIKAS